MKFGPSDVDRFRVVVADRLGLQFDDDRSDHLLGILDRRVEATHSASYAAYHALLTSPVFGREELRAVAEQATVGETYFFRSPDHYRAFIDHCVPRLLRDLGGRRPLRVLSAGCSSGEEAFTLAILLREHFPALGPADAEVRGVDLNPAAIRRAERARYSAWSLRETPPDLQRRYFRAEGSDFALVDAARRGVVFEERNLLANDGSFWCSGAFDVIFCRNVTIYFSAETTRAVVSRFANSLSPGGFLFLGHAESLRGLSREFEPLKVSDTFCYQRRDPALPASPELGASWYENIERASERIARLAAQPAAARRERSPTPPPVAPAGPAARDVTPRDAATASLDRARELFRQERFAEALDALGPDAPGDPEAQLLRAAILLNRSDLDGAERACRDVLSRDSLDAGAHYITGFCRVQAGDVGDAARHLGTAVRLDPSFAMPHMQIGLLARRAGDPVRARRSLERALILLATEDAARLLLFGGGFSREALVRLCRAELDAERSR